MQERIEKRIYAKNAKHNIIHIKNMLKYMLTFM